MWDTHEARLRAEVVYRQECCRLAVASTRRVQRVARQPGPPSGATRPPAWRRWFALVRLAVASFGRLPARTRTARPPRA